jgi:hypothetical protein
MEKFSVTSAKNAVSGFHEARDLILRSISDFTRLPLFLDKMFSGFSSWLSF